MDEDFYPELLPDTYTVKPGLFDVLPIVRPKDTVAGVETYIEVNFTTTNPIPPNGHIEFDLPQNYTNVNATRIVRVDGLDGVLSVNSYDMADFFGGPSARVCICRGTMNCGPEQPYPTPAPSSEPSSLPTFLPTPRPSPTPTEIPTTSPTPLPTTPRPSSVPTFIPTPAPTAEPTFAEYNLVEAGATIVLSGFKSVQNFTASHLAVFKEALVESSEFVTDTSDVRYVQVYKYPADGDAIAINFTIHMSLDEFDFDFTEPFWFNYSNATQIANNRTRVGHRMFSHKWGKKTLNPGNVSTAAELLTSALADDLITSVNSSSPPNFASRLQEASDPPNNYGITWSSTLGVNWRPTVASLMKMPLTFRTMEEAYTRPPSPLPTISAAPTAEPTFSAYYLVTNKAQMIITGPFDSPNNFTDRHVDAFKVALVQSSDYLTSAADVKAFDVTPYSIPATEANSSATSALMVNFTMEVNLYDFNTSSSTAAAAKVS